MCAMMMVRVAMAMKTVVIIADIPKRCFFVVACQVFAYLALAVPLE